MAFMVRAMKRADPQTSQRTLFALTNNSFYPPFLPLQANAMVNYARGGGWEMRKNYPNVQLMYFKIHNIHAMRSSINKVADSCFPCPDDTHWSKALINSGWLYHIKHLIFAAVSVADKVSYRFVPFYQFCLCTPYPRIT